MKPVNDILGLTGEAEKFGKPIGSDIREGKRTTIIWYAYKKANKKERHRLEVLLGKKNASKKEIKEAISLVERLGGIEATDKLAVSYIDKAKYYLSGVPDSKYKKMLMSWADFMIARSV